MIGFEVVAFMLFVRILIPFGLIMLIGEWVRQHEAKYWLDM